MAAEVILERNMNYWSKAIRTILERNMNYWSKAIRTMSAAEFLERNMTLK